MPRPNRSRTIGGEANLADRVRREIGRRDWSPAELARRLTDAGCPIQTSAIYKMLDGSPPRRITVDELLGLAEVFGVTPEDLLLDIDLVDRREAQQLLRAMDTTDLELVAAARNLVDLYSGVIEVVGRAQAEMEGGELDGPERALLDYLDGHLGLFAHERAGDLAASRLLGSTLAGQPGLAEAIGQVHNAAFEIAADLRGLDPNGQHPEA